SNEQHSIFPFRDFLLLENLRLFRALVPGELDGRHPGARAVFIGNLIGGRGGFRARRRAVGFDGKWMAQLERPKGHVVPMAAQVRQSATTEIPIFVPLWAAADITGMKRARRCWTEPQVPMQIFGDRFRILGPVSVSPGARDP